MCRRPVSSSISNCRITSTSSPNSACCANCARSLRKTPKYRRCRRPRNERASLQFRLSRRTDQADDPPRDPQGDRDPRLSGAVRQPRNADALWLGHRRRAGHRRDPWAPGRAEGRSEEHTSELQSRGHLVCRLLLEKKKTKLNTLTHSSNKNRKKK